jgi:phage baseplate assembly protein gpV
MTWMIKGPINLSATGGPITLTTDGECTITAAKCTVIAPEIVLDGNVTITKDLIVQGTTNMKQAYADPNCRNADGSGGGTRGAN